MASASKDARGNRGLVAFELEDVPRLVRQAELFPIGTLVEYPGSIDTAEAWGEVIAEDSHNYVVKTSQIGSERVPASEWIGTLIVDALGIPCATPRVIRLQNQNLVFGSRKIQGVASKVETSRLLISRAGANSVPVPGLCAALSEIYAVDMFLGNVDRHDENFVAIRDGQSYLLIPIDFGQSLFWNRSLDVFPSSVQPTRRYGLEIRSQHGFDVRAANAIIDRIAALPSSTISGILSATPSDWLSDRERSEFEGWWSLGGPTAKLESLRRGLSDGTLLSSQLFVLLPTPSGGKALTLV